MVSILPHFSGTFQVWILTALTEGWCWLYHKITFSHISHLNKMAILKNLGWIKPTFLKQVSLPKLQFLNLLFRWKNPTNKKTPKLSPTTPKNPKYLFSSMHHIRSTIKTFLSVFRFNFRKSRFFSLVTGDPTCISNKIHLYSGIHHFIFHLSAILLNHSNS